MHLPRTLLAMVVLVWAGLSLGGNLIAAPAKFQLVEIPMRTLLQVGRAQFNWLGATEWSLLAILVAGLIFCRPRLWVWLLLSVPAAVFVGQQLVVMPLLQERTMQVIAGNASPAGNAHIIFIGLELLKLLGLLCAGFALANRSIEGD